MVRKTAERGERLNFYPRFLGDYMRDTAHLSMLQHGAYTMLLDTYYATGKPLPEDMAALYRICKASTALERKAVDVVATAFFPLNGDGLRHNNRADMEIDRQTERTEVSRMVGNLGGRPKVKKQKPQGSLEQTSGLSTDNRKGSENETNHNHNQKEQKQGAFAPPDWVPLEPWNAYVEMRRTIKRPMTKWAAVLAVRTLDTLKAQGHDPSAVLNQSIFNSWQGLFPVHGGGSKKVAL